METTPGFRVIWHCWQLQWLGEAESWKAGKWEIRTNNAAPVTAAAIKQSSSSNFSAPHTHTVVGVGSSNHPPHPLFPFSFSFNCGRLLGFWLTQGEQIGQESGTRQQNANHQSRWFVSMPPPATHFTLLCISKWTDTDSGRGGCFSRGFRGSEVG